MTRALWRLGRPDTYWLDEAVRIVRANEANKESERREGPSVPLEAAGEPSPCADVVVEMWPLHDAGCAINATGHRGPCTCDVVALADRRKS